MATSQTYAAELRQRMQAASQSPPPTKGPTPRGGADPFALDERRQGLQALLEVFDRSPTLQTLLGDIIGRRVIASAQRLIQRLERQAPAYARRQTQQDRPQRRENVTLSLVSLLAGWGVSLLGAPATVVHQFLR
jgi:hypothetical protein